MLGIPQNDPRLSFEGNMWVSCADGSTHWELYWGPCTLYRGPTPYQDQDPNTILCAVISRREVANLRDWMEYMSPVWAVRLYNVEYGRLSAYEIMRTQDLPPTEAGVQAHVLRYAQQNWSVVPVAAVPEPQQPEPQQPNRNLDRLAQRRRRRSRSRTRRR